ncbi:carph-isopro domain-containing protein [Sphingomonas aurea]|uniref:carph-isopro domain-containing protein n=1 Tax=Sphingomonas aurea TaxID=3063994 RepID=UPI00351D28E2
MDALGGVTAVANECGLPLTTVHSWKRAGYVPAWRVPELVRVAERLGSALDPSAVPTRNARPITTRATA